MPGKPYQSKLQPFYDFIRECRAKRWSYAQIAHALGAEHGLKVSANTVFSFVKVRTKGRRQFVLPSKTVKTEQASAVDTKHAHEFFQPTSPTIQNNEPKKRSYNLGL